MKKELTIQSLPKTDSNSHGEYFQHRLEGILNSRLTPDNIGEYTNQALGSIIDLTGEITNSFGGTTDNSLKGMELEDKAYEYYGLSGIGEILDRIEVVNAKLEKIDTKIENLNGCGEVIVPPDEIYETIIPGGMDLLRKRQIFLV